MAAAHTHYVYDITEADGIRLPIRRRAFRRGADLRPDRSGVMVSIDLSDIRFS